MRKEVAFAVIAGVSIGLIIAFGSWRVTKTLKRKPITSEIQKTPPQKGNLVLDINNLSDYDIITEKLFKVTGISKPQSIIVISTTEEDFYTKSNDDGSFEIDMSFPAGLSEVIINDLSLQTIQKMTLINSSEFKKYLDKGNYKSMAYIGTITDISSGNIQIKSMAGDIKQMSITEETSFINTLKKNVEIKASDLAIGDYLVAMGFVDGNKVLDTKRILVSSPMLKNNYEAIYGVIQDVSKTKLTINKTDGETLSIKLPKSWKGPDVKNLSDDQKIIVIGKIDNEVYSLRSVFTPVE